MTYSLPQLLILLKEQLNIEHELDDNLLIHKLAVADEWISNFTGIQINRSDPFTPFSFSEAALQLAAYWYVQREAVSDTRLTSIPFGVIELLRPFREEVTGHVAV